MGDPLTRADGASAGPRPVPGDVVAPRRGRTRSGVHALPPRPPRRRGCGRGHRRPTLGRLRAGSESSSDRAGGAAGARRPASFDGREALVLIVVALGGNALLRRGEPLDAEVQRRNVKTRGPRDRGAGPGASGRRHARQRPAGRPAGAAGRRRTPRRLSARRARRRERGDDRLSPRPGTRQRASRLETSRRSLTQVVVDPDDPAFEQPTKPVGPSYDEATAQHAGDGARLVGRSGRGSLAARRRRHPCRATSSSSPRSSCCSKATSS